jgi:hypothetical protein
VSSPTDPVKPFTDAVRQSRDIEALRHAENKGPDKAIFRVELSER